MKPGILLFISFLLVLPVATAQKVPDGYILQYGQNFNNNNALGDFDFSDPAAWGISKSENNFFLQFNLHQAAIPQATLPANQAILSKRIFGDFILEADVLPLADSGRLPEFCIFVGMKNTEQYYLILLSAASGEDLQGIFLVKNGILTKLPETFDAHGFKSNTWQKIRVERNIVKRTIRVFVNDMNHPVFHAKDYEFIMGKVGVGSMNSAVCFDNLVIWAPTVIPEE
jgi:hypothetical protein